MVQSLLVNPIVLRSADEAMVFRSADEFQPIRAVTGGFTIPLASRAGGARATWRLSQSIVVVQQTFPRIMEADIVLPGVMAIMPLRGPGFVANGFACGDCTVLLLRGSARTHFLEAQGGLTAIVSFDAAASSRQWPVKEGAVSFLKLPRAAMQSIRTSVRDIARARAEGGKADLHAALRETFGSAIDSGELTGTRGRRARMRYVDIVRRADDLLAERPTQPISNDDVVHEIGLSERTLNKAFCTIRGLSMHRYLRLRRLWSVRRQLLTSGMHVQIGRIARAHGFSHMGEFAAAYKSAFGETPSETAGLRPSQR